MNKSREKSFKNIYVKYIKQQNDRTPFIFKKVFNFLVLTDFRINFIASKIALCFSEINKYTTKCYMFSIYDNISMQDITSWHNGKKPTTSSRAKRKIQVHCFSGKLA